MKYLRAWAKTRRIVEGRGALGLVTTYTNMDAVEADFGKHSELYELALRAFPSDAPAMTVIRVR